jgi:hypothetical protein
MGMQSISPLKKLANFPEGHRHHASFPSEIPHKKCCISPGDSLFFLKNMERMARNLIILGDRSGGKPCIPRSVASSRLWMEK